MRHETEQRQHDLDQSWDFDPKTGIAIAVACVVVAAMATLVVLMVIGLQHAPA